MRKEFKRNKKQKNNQASDKKEGHRLFLDEQYIRMAEEMERELFADGDSEIYESTDEEEARSYQILINRLKADGIYQEDDVEPDIGKKVVPLHRKIRLGKVAGVAILCCACIFAASMTSQANRNYLVNNIRVWSGNDTKTVVDNSEQNEKVDTAEYEAVEEIEKQLGVEVPEFYYRPNGFEFVSYEIDVFANLARVEYEYQNNIILFVIDTQNVDTASRIISMDEAKEAGVVKSEEGSEIIIEKIQGKIDEKPSYLAQWELNHTIYYMSGRIEEQELKKILEQMKF